MLQDERLTRIAADDDPRVERDPTEEREAELHRRVLPAAPFEDIDPLAAVRADIAAHIFDNPDDRQPHGAREADALPHVEE